MEHSRSQFEAWLSFTPGNLDAKGVKISSCPRMRILYADAAFTDAHSSGYQSHHLIKRYSKAATDTVDGASLNLAHGAPAVYSALWRWAGGALSAH
jgi:hypothetical protein